MAFGGDRPQGDTALGRDQDCREVGPGSHRTAGRRRRVAAGHGGRGQHGWFAAGRRQPPDTRRVLAVPGHRAAFMAGPGAARDGDRRAQQSGGGRLGSRMWLPPVGCRFHRPARRLSQGLLGLVEGCQRHGREDCAVRRQARPGAGDRLHRRRHPQRGGCVGGGRRVATQRVGSLEPEEEEHLLLRVGSADASAEGRGRSVRPAGRRAARPANTADRRRGGRRHRHEFIGADLDDQR